MLGVYTIVEAADHGWGSARTLGLGAVALALLAAFVVARGDGRPPAACRCAIFRSRNVAGANVVQMLMVAGMFGMFFLGALYLQRVLGYDALEVGLAFLPVALAIGALSLGVSARLITRFGAARRCCPALVLIAAGLALFARAPVDGRLRRPTCCPSMLLLGIGAGLAFPALMTLAMSGAAPERLRPGLRAWSTRPSRWAARSASPCSPRSSTTRTETLPPTARRRAALTGGYHLAFGVGAALVLAALVLAVVILRPQRAEATEAARTRRRHGMMRGVMAVPERTLVPPVSGNAPARKSR